MQKLIGVDPNGNKVTLVAMLNKGKKGLVFSISGEGRRPRARDSEYCGQIQDIIREELPNYKEFFMRKEDIIEVLDIWDRWHLNDMRAGTPKQEKALRQKPEIVEYTERCEYLKKLGIYEDNGYKYGHGWLYEPLPIEVIVKIVRLLS